MINKKLVTLVSLGLLSITPLIASAYTPPGQPGTLAAGTTVSGLISIIFNNFFWPVFITVAIIYLLTVGLMFLFAQGEPEKVNTARMALIWGVAGIAVIVIAASVLPIIIAALGAIF